MAQPVHSRRSAIKTPAAPSRSDRRASKRPLLLALAGTALIALTSTGTARADDGAALIKAKNCTACHAVDKKLIGPSYKDVATKYAGDPNAVEKLSKKIRDGGVGTWGQIPMPANPQVSAAEGTQLATWILSQK